MADGGAVMYVGTYTAGNKNNAGIHIFNIDGGGRITKTGESDRINNPSYLAIEGGFLYSVMEEFSPDGERAGGIAAYRIAGLDGRLEYLNRKITNQRGSCHLSVSDDGRYIAAANYGEGSVALFRRDEDGTVGGVSDVYNMRGELGPNAERQERTHAHCAVFRGKELFVADLGTDLISCFTIADDKLSPSPARSFAAAPGSGPRHIACAGKYMLCVNELTSDVTVYSDEGDKFIKLGTYPMLPDGFDRPNTAAAIHVSPCGRFAFASNRGHDSVASYEIGTDGRLTPVSITPTRGAEPRDFSLTPDGKFLVAANQNSDTLTVFSVSGGALDYAGEYCGVPSPVCVKFR